MRNPLIDTQGLPQFAEIRPENAVPAIEKILSQNRAKLRSIIDDASYSWDRSLAPLEEINDTLNRAWSPISHMNSVVDNEELRAAYNICIQKITEYTTELGQNECLYRVYKTLFDSDEYSTLDQAQQKVVQNALRDFRLFGVDLETDDKERFKAIKQRLSQLQTKFEEHLLDATLAFKKPIANESLLAGLPATAKALAEQNAQRDGHSGWLLNLEFPSYIPVMTYVDSRELRHEMYQAYMTRASDQGPNAGRWDNSEVMTEILALRHELARLVGYNNYAEYSMVTKMAESPQQVLAFLHDLVEKSLPKAREEIAELNAFALEQHKVSKLEAWDVAYYSEKLRQQKHAIDQEALRSYFPVPRVLCGLFSVTERLFGLDIQEIEDIQTWHTDVRFFDIRDTSGQVRGQFYLDLYARPHKRGGAWMDECRARKCMGDELQIPVAYLTCNFTPPIGDAPALLTHNEVTTLFHEFGHGLHHMLTQVDFPSVAGINGVVWDAVELPSQFLENWCWEREALDSLSGHFKTGEPIDASLFQRMQAARNFQAGMQMARQLELALFDLQLHLLEQPPSAPEIQACLDAIRQRVAVVIPPAFSRFQHSFSHIFAGGYAAGYYSYKWAEVLSADAFSKFEENGIFHRQTGEHFLHEILEQGGTREALDLFVNFRGRKPSVEALLRHSGIT